MKRTSFCGISMATRSRRRYFVLAVYAGLAVVLLGPVVVWHRFEPVQPTKFLDALSFVFSFLFIGVSRGLFGYLVREDTSGLPDDMGGDTAGKLISIFESQKSRWGVPDERDLAVRNRAYYIAFRIVALYTTVLWLSFSVFGSFRSEHLVLNLASVYVFTLLVMALTLPQAVLLWIEPDLQLDDSEPVATPRTAS